MLLALQVVAIKVVVVIVVNVAVRVVFWSSVHIMSFGGMIFPFKYSPKIEACCPSIAFDQYKGH